jgi:hypothetical protein
MCWKVGGLMKKLLEKTSPYMLLDERRARDYELRVITIEYWPLGVEYHIALPR